LLRDAGAHPHLLERKPYFGQNIPPGGTAHQASTARFGTDPANSVLDLNCKAHEVDNLYVCRRDDCGTDSARAGASYPVSPGPSGFALKGCLTMASWYRRPASKADIGYAAGPTRFAMECNDLDPQNSR
jgi:hypothetical protein